MTHLDKWASQAYYEISDEPWELLPESSKILWRNFIAETFMDRAREGL